MISKSIFILRKKTKQKQKNDVSDIITSENMDISLVSRM